MNKLGRITITFLLALTGLGVQAKIITYPVPTGIYYCLLYTSDAAGE